MKIETIRRVVSTPHYEYKAYKWDNTNFLLKKKGFVGTKTGITKAAGPCLACTYEEGENRFVVVVLCSRSME